jgi:hypothetical protein
VAAKLEIGASQQKTKLGTNWTGVALLMKTSTDLRDGVMWTLGRNPRSIVGVKMTVGRGLGARSKWRVSV